MTVRNPISVPDYRNIGFGSAHSNPDRDKPLADEERERIREHYRSLNFKEFLAACPIDGVDLTRELEYPREVEL